MCDKAAQIELRPINHCLTKRAVIRGLLVRNYVGSIIVQVAIDRPACDRSLRAREECGLPREGRVRRWQTHGKIEAYIPSKNDRPFAECAAYW
jgi:hypothetical protein